MMVIFIKNNHFISLSLSLFTDRNDFISNSGWFQFPGLPLGKEAQLNVLAKKAGLNYETFINTKRAVYVLSYRQEKVTLLKVAPKSGQSPCTIVQGCWPNFAKNVKLRILSFYNIF